MLVAKVLLGCHRKITGNWSCLCLWPRFAVAMGKSLEIGRAYACGQGAAVAIGKSLEIGRAYACGQGVAVAMGQSLEIGRAYVGIML
ncbi:hypothetical protein OROMI_021486 [Orobanche minor]